MARALGRRQANGLWLTVLTGLCALLVAGVVVAVAPTNVAWLGVCAALFALLALVWPLAGARGEAGTGGWSWAGRRTRRPRMPPSGSRAGYSSSPSPSAIGFWWRALRPRTLALSLAGIHLSAVGRVVPWRDVSDVVAESRVVKHSMRLPDDSAPSFVMWTQKGDRIAVRLDNFLQHPSVILGMLTAYAAHPTLRPELGTPLAVERSRAMTAALADLRSPAGHGPG